MDNLQSVIAQYPADQVVFLIDEKIPRPAIGDILSACPAAAILALPICEQDKSLDTVRCIWDFLFDRHITRHGLLVCIGGGVLTDLGGFAAATYKRGMDYINIPSTLLAMVDASTGGKTGFNYHGLKNAIGAFYPPKQTFIRTGLLHSLAPADILSGLAEMLKTALLEPSPEAPGLLNALYRYDLDTMPIEPLEPLIRRCLEIKESVVRQDLNDTGIRKALNLGHTFAHALEAADLAAIPHGYAVLYGLIAELYLSVTRLNCPREPLQQLTQRMLHYYGRPVCNCSDRDQLIRRMQHDKKNEQTDTINCTLLRNIGQPVINQTITPADAREAWDYLFSL